MRITAKGQVTIPVRIREQAGLLPNTDVEFACDGAGKVRLFKARAKGKSKTRGERLIEHFQKVRETHPIRMTTEEIMKLTRGED